MDSKHDPQSFIKTLELVFTELKTVLIFCLSLLLSFSDPSNWHNVFQKQVFQEDLQ